MKALQVVSLSTACALALLAAEANAITYPDNSPCNTTGKCLYVDNSSTHTGAAAIYGEAKYNGVGGYGDIVGVFGQSNSGTGVYGDSISSVGIYGMSQTGNGVVGQNTRTDWNAAAISAIPGNSNGLAIWAGGVVQKPGGGSWSSTSDARVKKDVKDFELGLAELMRLRPVSYKYNGLGKTQDDGNVFVGVIAQELEKVLPSMVTSHKVKLRPGDTKETDLRHVDPSAFTYVLINAVQEQQRTIERQDARIQKLERGDSPAIAYGNLGGALALGLIPLGLVAIGRRRKQSDGQE